MPQSRAPGARPCGCGAGAPLFISDNSDSDGTVIAFSSVSRANAGVSARLKRMPAAAASMARPRSAAAAELNRNDALHQYKEGPRRGWGARVGFGPLATRDGRRVLISGRYRQGARGASARDNAIAMKTCSNFSCIRMIGRRCAYRKIAFSSPCHRSFEVSAEGYGRVRVTKALSRALVTWSQFHTAG